MSNELRITLNDDSATVYFILRRVSDNKVWDVANTEWATWDDANIGDYDIAGTSRGGDLYTADFPTSIAIGTSVLVFRYLQAGGSPAITDLKLGPAIQQNWSGSGLSGGGSVTLSTYALATLEALKRELSITGTDYDDLLKQLINAASNRIEQQTGRKFKARTHYERVKGHGRYFVNNSPLIHVNRIATGDANSFYAQYSGSDSFASMAVSPDAVRVLSWGSGGTTTNTYDFATYTKASDIVSQINGLTGWSATTQNDCPSAWLKPKAGISAKDANAYGTFEDNAGVAFDIDENCSALLIEGAYGDFYGVGCQYFVEYVGGYETIPDDLAALCIQIASQAFNRAKHDTSLQSESLGGYSYSLIDAAMNEESIRKQINRWGAVQAFGAC